MEHSEILKLVESYYDNTDENVLGVGYGYKMVNGLFTNEKSIIFTVKEKKPLSSLSQDKVIPQKIDTSNGSISTDVIQGDFNLICDSSFYNWMTTPPSNRNKIRPLKGGVSVTNFSSLQNSVGTLGLLARDNDSNSLVGVSNNHVLINDAFIASQRNPNNILTNVKFNSVTQPNESGNMGIQNSIGFVKKYYPIRSGQFNYIDVAITTINESEIDYNESYKQEGLSTTTLNFATTNEINSLLTTNPLLFSAGRTTGAKGEGNTKLVVIASPSVISTIYYNKQGSPTPISFSDCIQFVASGSTIPNGSVCIYPINSGDSGSALIADFNGEKKIIGLVFASGSNGSEVVYGYACRIDRIAQSMNISPWNGESLNFSNINNVEEYPIDGLSDQIFIEANGKKYWQVGVRNKI